MERIKKFRGPLHDEVGAILLFLCRFQNDHSCRFQIDKAAKIWFVQMRSNNVVLTDVLLQAKSLRLHPPLVSTLPVQRKTISLPPTVGFNASRRATLSSRNSSMERRKVPHFKTFLPSDLSFRISSTSLLSMTSSTVMKPDCSIAWL